MKANSMYQKVVPLLNKTGGGEPDSQKQESRFEYTRSSEFQEISNHMHSDTKTFPLGSATKPVGQRQQGNVSQMPTEPKNFVSSKLIGA